VVDTKKSNGSKHRAIKISVETYNKVQELIGLVKQKGWAALGAKRDDLATNTAIVDEAIMLLLQRRDTTAARAAR
jgi:hypothetical protein